MSDKIRYISTSILKDLLTDHKMAFITGPRQVGKTTLAHQLLTTKKSEEFYFNFDDEEFKRIRTKNPKDLIKNLNFQKNDLIIFDEIHKDSKWKSKLKGLYDLYKKDLNFLITGSAHLNFYRKSGDSLQGRYYPYRLHPFSVGEISNIKPPPEKSWDEHLQQPQFKLSDLDKLSGFPDPLLSGNQNKAKRLLRLYRERLIKEDLRDLSNVRDINLIQTMSLLLIDKAGGQFSYESIRQDLNSSFDSVNRWLSLLEATYFTFLIRPYSKNIKNSLKKEPKCYLYDWTPIENNGRRFENIMAMHLLKNVHAWTDFAFGEFELYYIRDKQKREVDFLITKDSSPYLLLEVKSRSTTLSPSLIHFNEVLKPKFCIQLVDKLSDERKPSLLHPNIRIMSSEKFLGSIN